MKVILKPCWSLNLWRRWTFCWKIYLDVMLAEYSVFKFLISFVKRLFLRCRSGLSMLNRVSS